MPAEADEKRRSDVTAKGRPVPAVFLGHGSPMNALEENRYTASWRTFGETVPRPRAILVVSAHWYVNATAVTAMRRSSCRPFLTRRGAKESRNVAFREAAATPPPLHTGQLLRHQASVSISPDSDA